MTNNWNVRNCYCQNYYYYYYYYCLRWVTVFWWANQLSISSSHQSRTQPPAVSGIGNKHHPKCGDALRLGRKGTYGSFHLWISVQVAGKTVWSGVITCYTWAL